MLIVYNKGGIKGFEQTGIALQANLQGNFVDSLSNISFISCRGSKIDLQEQTFNISIKDAYFFLKFPANAQEIYPMIYGSYIICSSICNSYSVHFGGDKIRNVKSIAKMACRVI